MGSFVANQNTYRFAHGDHLGENIITILTESCGGNVNGGKRRRKPRGTRISLKARAKRPDGSPPRHTARALHRRPARCSRRSGRSAAGRSLRRACPSAAAALRGRRARRNQPMRSITRISSGADEGDGKIHARAEHVVVRDGFRRVDEADRAAGDAHRLMERGSLRTAIGSVSSSSSPSCQSRLRVTKPPACAGRISPSTATVAPFAHSGMRR